MILAKIHRKTEGQHLQGKFVSALLHTFSCLSRNVQSFSELFPPRLSVKFMGFILVQRDSKTKYENKIENCQTILHVSCCMFVLFQEKHTNFTRNSVKKSFFPGDFEVVKSIEN